MNRSDQLKGQMHVRLCQSAVIVKSVITCVKFDWSSLNSMHLQCEPENPRSHRSRGTAPHLKMPMTSLQQTFPQSFTAVVGAVNVD